LAKGVKQFYVPGLRDNPQKGFKRSCVHIPVSVLNLETLTLVS
jgi:hypothetical protein